MTRPDSWGARRQLAVLLAGAAILFAACGGSATYGSPTLAPTVAPTAAPASVPAPATAAPSAASGGGGRYGSASASPTSVSPTPVATTTTAASVEIANFAFAPGNLTIKAGTAVTWTNRDAVAHTVTATDEAFDSGQLGTATTFSHTFVSAGAFTYHCTIHPAMTAIITVTP